MDESQSQSSRNLLRPMPIKGNVLYAFRWFWRQDISTQSVLPQPPVVSQPLKAPSAGAQKKR
jgi:hypothetical protein